MRRLQLLRDQPADLVLLDWSRRKAGIAAGLKEIPATQTIPAHRAHRRG